MLGILFWRACIFGSLSVLSIICILFALLLFCSGVIIYAILTKKRNSQSRARENVSSILISSSIGLCVSFLVGMVLSIAPFSKVSNVKNYDKEVVVYGTVCDYVSDEKTYTKFLINNVLIEDDNNLDECKFKICVYTTKSSDIALGSNIEFACELDSYSVFSDFDDYKLYQDIGYGCYVNYSDITVLEGKQTIKDKIKNSTNEILHENLNNDNAGIFYAVLYGDKVGLSDDTSNMFSYAGISHILAVSGLHISVIVSIFYFLMKKCKVNKIVRLVLLSALLIFYSYLCSFTSSVCRASIMAILLCLCDVLKIEYDSLSSLSIAGIILLLFTPLRLFEVSFQLSFLCIFSIISISPSINNFLTKIKCPKFLAASLAMSIATNIAILPICLNVFTKVSLLGVVANIFILPLFSISYVLLFVIVFISLIFHFMGFLLVLPNLFLHIIKVVADYIASIPFGVFKSFNVSYWSLVLLIGSAISLHFLLTKNLIKGSISLALAVMVFVIFIVSSVSKTYDNTNFIFLSKYKSNACYYVEDGEITLVGSSASASVIQNEMKKLRLKEISNVIAYDLSLNKLEDFLTICNEYNVKNVYLPKHLDYEEVKNKFNNSIIFDTNIKIKSLEFMAMYYSDAITAVYLDAGTFNRILIPELKPTQGEGDFISNYCKNLTVDVIYIDKSCSNLDYAKIKPQIKVVNDDYIYYKDNSKVKFDIYLYN